MSKLIYPAHTFKCPDRTSQGGENYLTQIQNSIWDFFWGAHAARVDRNILTLPVDEGGLAVTEIVRQLRSVRLTKISQLFNPEVPGKWKTLARYQLNKFRNYHAGENVFKTFLPRASPASWGVSEFYRALLSDWCELTNNERPRPVTIDDIHSEPLYHNRFVAHTDEATGLPEL